jgi:hypothetical protein
MPVVPASSWRSPLSLAASATSDRPMPVILRYFDVALVLVAAPILLLIGVPALGYGIGAGAWIALRAVGVGVERAATASHEMRTQVGLRLSYMLGRLFALALAVVAARRAGSQGDGLAALGVVVVAFTVQLATSALSRLGSR